MLAAAPELALTMTQLPAPAKAYDIVDYQLSVARPRP